MTNELDKNIRYLHGVGEKKAALFAKLGIYTIGDLLMFFPRTYEDWNGVYEIAEAPIDREVCVSAILLSPITGYRTRSGSTVYSTTVSDGKNFMALTFFNNRFVTKSLHDGEEYLFFGKIKTNDNGMREMVAPKYASPENGGYLHPVYPQTKNLNSKAIAKAVRTALDGYGKYLQETLPEAQIKKFRLASPVQAIEKIHFPKNTDDIKCARRRLIYEELLVLQLGILQHGRTEREGTHYTLQKDLTDEFASKLPYSLTNAQKKAISECISDMKQPMPMRRLLQGDVGSGKTAVAASLIYTCINNGFQCALMAPTEVLASQHFKSFSEMFAGSGIKTELLTGSVTAKNKRLIKERTASGETDLLIGTHALITEDTEFKNLALTVTDEQHRFGVMQRAKLRQKGTSPHVLVMSATPIPRTLSLIIYGDLDISVLDEKPVGRQEIKTYRVTGAYRERLYGFIKKEVAKGRQCYIVCPLVEENPDNPSEKTDATGHAKMLSESIFKEQRTDLLHGKMTPKQKDEVMLRFKNGETDILICTVVVEVGIDVPNATLMVIENAECFGLSQLHQLRGRVGRGKEQSYCVLISDSENSESVKRLDVLCSTNDGFKIADEDMRMRGPGDFFGSRQSGLPLMKTADLMTDQKILYVARDEAQSILGDDPELQKKENSGLKNRISSLFTDIS